MAQQSPSSKQLYTVVSPIIEQYFQVSLLALLSMGFLTLAATGKLDAVSSICVSVALLLRGYLFGRGTTLRIPERVTSYLGLCYVLFYVLDLLYISNNFVLATVHLLLFGIVIKMFSIYRDRDYAYLAMLAFFEILCLSRSLHSSLSKCVAPRSAVVQYRRSSFQPSWGRETRSASAAFPMHFR
jgi:hypothetical protein